MNTLFYLACALVFIGVISGAAYRWQFCYWAPLKYAQLKKAGRFETFPQTWEELVRLCHEPPDEFERKMEMLAEMEDRRVFYRRFVAKELMPAGFTLHLGAIATSVGFALLVVWGIARVIM